MTEHRIRILEDGTRVYSNGTRYKPKSADERVYQVRKPDDPSAFRWRGYWLYPLPLLQDEARPPVPETRPDTDAYDHMTKGHRCRCQVCKRPQARKWRKKWKRDQIRTAPS